MSGGKETAAVTRFLAQTAVVVAVLVGAKTWLAWRVAGVTPASPRLLLGLQQDLILALALGGLLAVTALPAWRPLRLLGETTVMLALLANCVLVIIAREVHGLVTVDADAPQTWGALQGVLAEFGSVPRYVGLLLVGAAVWVAPALAARGLLRPRWLTPLFAVGGPVALLACAFGTAFASSTWSDDVFEVASLRNNPLVHWASGALGKEGFRSARGASPASFDDIGRALAPLVDDGSAGGAAELEELADGRFNVVLVVLESVGMSAFDLEASASDRHPFLSRMRDQAIRFARYSSPAPHSETALTAIACSQLRLPIGLDEQDRTAIQKCRPLPAVLEAGGVQTALFQSTFVGDWIDGSFFDRLQFGLSKDASRVIAERHASGREVESRNGILQEHETVGELLGWIDERCARREPFFGMYYSWVAHAPYPAEHAGRFSFAPDLPARDRHRGLVRTLDEQLGRIWAALDRDSCGRPSVLLVTGDHGEAFDEHPGNRYHVMHVYEENVHVPLVVIAPGLRGRRVDRAASHIDLAPTIVDLAVGPEALRVVDGPPSAEQPGRPYQGRSLLRPAPSRPAFSVSLQGEGRASIRYGRYKMILSPRSSWLFDTDADPGEHVDLAARQPDVARALREAFRGWVSHQLAYQGRS